MKDHDKISSQLSLPYLETHDELIKEIFMILEQEFALKRDSNQGFIDLGSGDGRIVIFCGFNYGIKALGIEINENLIKEANENLRVLKNRHNLKKKQLKHIRIEFGDLFRQDLQDFDFIYTYSLPTMHKYMNHVFITAKNNAVIISHKYPLKGFDTYLKLEYELIHKTEKQELTTYFYRKV